VIVVAPGIGFLPAPVCRRPFSWSIFSFAI